MNNTVSVIIPVYNQEKYIEQCLNSVVNQTYTNLEIIVIDDCSTDSSINIVNNFMNKDNRIKLIELPENKGVSTARNTGIDMATGDYICFIDSDDVWVLNKIEKQVKFMNENNYEFIYSNYAYLSERHKNSNINNNRNKTTNVPKKITYKEAIKNTTIFVSTVMLNMHKLTKEQIYMPNYEIAQDTATWWKILKYGITAHGMSEVLAFYRVGIKSLSSNKFKAVLGSWKVYLKEEMSWIKRIYCFVCYIVNATLRRA